MNRKTYSYEEAFEASLKYFNGNELSAKVFLDKYALRDREQNVLEKTPEDMHWRMAKEFARIEKKKFKKPLSEEKIFSYFDRFKYIVPQGSPCYGIGNKEQSVSLSNCFVIPSPADSYGGILKTDQEIVQISKRRGGIGTDVSNLRPNGTETHNASRTSTGIVPFCGRFSNSLREVGQDGRRGAGMLSCHIKHPQSVTPWDNDVDGKPFTVSIRDKDIGNFDISSKYYNPNKLDFCTMKYDRSKVTGANVSIRISDEFMVAATERKGMFTQQWPIDAENPKIKVKINAVDAWDKIIHSAWQTAEPGVLFWDTIARESVADCYAKFGFKSTTTNPCVTGDTWIMTSNGPEQVKNLINNKFVAVVNGREYELESNGFFLTGIKKVKKIKLSRGYTIRLTEDHKIMTTDGWVAVSDLKKDTKICLSNHRAFDYSWSGNGSMKEGYLVGSLLGDGCFCDGVAYLDYWGENKEEALSVAKKYLKESVIRHRSDCGSADSNTICATTYDKVRLGSSELSKYANLIGLNDNKTLREDIEKTSCEFYRGFLGGWFDADGTVGKDDEKGSYSVRLSSSILDNLIVAQRMLSRLGIVSSIYENRREAGFRDLPDGKGGVSQYWCKSQHELSISKDNILIFSDLIGFHDNQKAEKLSEIIKNYTKGPYAEKFVSTIESITDDGCEEVYDCTVADVHEFDANGIRVHNCGEIVLSPYDSCRLLVVNLFAFVKKPFTKNAYFDYKEFFEVAKIAQRLMDDLVDLEEEAINGIIEKVKKDPENDETKAIELNLWKKVLEACVNGRRTGTGITALGDVIAALNIGYGTEAGINEVERIYRTLKFASYTSSVEMSKELGPFPVWDHKLEKDNPFLNRIRKETVKLSDTEDEISGEDLWEDMKKYGRRNIANLTTAPVGSMSLLCLLIDEFGTSSGIEPEYDIVPVERKKRINPSDKNARVDFVDQNGDSWQKFSVYCSALKEWMKITGETDYKKSPWYKNTATELDWTVRVRIQSSAQKHVDHSISSTVNLPNDVTVEKVKEIYETAWKSGCKGVTVYRDGCRIGILTKKEDEKKEISSLIKVSHAPKRPEVLNCDIHHVKVTKTLDKVRTFEYLVIVGMLNGKPYEVFAIENGILDKKTIEGKLIKQTKGKYDLCVVEDGKEKILSNITKDNAEAEDLLTRMVSMSLRHGTPVQFIVQQLEKCGDLGAFNKAVMRSLKKYIEEGEEVEGISCKKCEKKGDKGKIVMQNGCMLCLVCGDSKCQ